MHLVFVYGTLMRGYSNHAYLAQQRYKGDHTTGPHYALYDLGGYPGIRETSHAPYAVKGEVWEVSAACLAELDELESVAEGEYERRLIPSPWGAAWCYFYLWPVAEQQRLQSQTKMLQWPHEKQIESQP